jgi:hypothetical protein
MKYVFKHDIDVVFKQITNLKIRNLQIIIRNHEISELFVIIFVFDDEYKDNRLLLFEQ